MGNNDLEYRIGGIDVPLETLKARSGASVKKFVVEAVENIVSIYLALADSHYGVVQKFGLKGRIVGGGTWG